MNLYFIRHGQAVENPSTGEKELTEIAKTELETHFENFKSLNPNFDVILSSPKVRAVQTAEILRNVFESRHNLTIEDRLKPGCNTEIIKNLVLDYPDMNLVIVGHLPDLSNIVSDLISNYGAMIEFSPGTIACVNIPGRNFNNGVLRCLLPIK